MKTSIFNYSLLWSGAAAAAVLQPRQFGSMKVEKPAKIVSVKPRYRETAKRDQIRFGPLTLPAAKVSAPKEAGHSHGASGAKPFNPLSILSGGFAMDPDGFAFGRQLEGGFCTDCTILAGKVDVVFENGTRADVANGVYLHHVISSITGKQPQVWASMCPKGATIALPAGLEKLIPAGLDLSKIDLSKILGARGGGAGFIGGAVDEFTDLFTSKDGKIDSGYYVPKNIKTTMSGEIINYLKEPQDVYIQFDIEYVPGRASKEAIKAALSVEGCGMPGAGFKTGPRGKIVSKEFEVLKDGDIISFRGHMHDGGVSVAAIINNKLACNSTAVYGLAGGQLVVEGKEWKTISKMNECLEPYPVKKGDKIVLEAVWDNELHPPRVSQGIEQEDMGFMQMTMVTSN